MQMLLSTNTADKPISSTACLSAPQQRDKLVPAQLTISAYIYAVNKFSKFAHHFWDILAEAHKPAIKLFGKATLFQLRDHE